MTKILSEETMTERRFFTLAETAARWRVSRQTVANLAARGELRSVHIGHRHLVPAAEITRFEQSLVA